MSAERWVLVDEVEPHVVALTEDGWTLRHPLRCRVDGNLLDCALTAACGDFDFLGLLHAEDLGFGLYEVALDEAGALAVGEWVRGEWPLTLGRQAAPFVPGVEDPPGGPTWTVDMIAELPEPQECSPDAEESGCSNKPTECTCKTGCGESREAGCCYCRHRDIYAPCPRGGFWCDPICGDAWEPCCTVSQRWFAASATAVVLARVCGHDSLTGDEGPVALLGRMPVRWRCDGCGAIVHTPPASDEVDQA